MRCKSHSQIDVCSEWRPDLNRGSVLITGGAGYVGSHIVLGLIECGRDVVVLDDLSTGSRAAVPPNVPFFEGDVGDERALSRVFSEFQIGAVIHLAGSAVTSDSFRYPIEYFRNNVCASRTLFENCVKHCSPHIILSSSAAVYGRSAGNRLVPESKPTAPESPYGASKELAEIFLQKVAMDHGLRYVCLRYFNVVGADPRGRAGLSNPASGHLFKVACEAVAGKVPFVEIYGADYDTSDGTCVRDYVHVTDLAAVHVAALSYLENNSNNLILNCGYGRGYSVREVLHSFKHVSGINFETRVGPRRFGDVPALVADVASLRNHLIWRPQYDDLDAMVGTALAWETKDAS